MASNRQYVAELLLKLDADRALTAAKAELRRLMDSADDAEAHLSKLFASLNKRYKLDLDVSDALGAITALDAKIEADKKRLQEARVVARGFADELAAASRAYQGSVRPNTPRSQRVDAQHTLASQVEDIARRAKVEIDAELVIKDPLAAIRDLQSRLVKPVEVEVTTNVAQAAGDADALTMALTASAAASSRVQAGAARVAEAMDNARQKADEFGVAAGRAGNVAAQGQVKTTLAAQNVTRIIQDLPYGMMGITNNIQALGDSLTYLMQETVAVDRESGKIVGVWNDAAHAAGNFEKRNMSLKEALKTTFTGLLAGPMAIGLVITLVSTLLLQSDKLAAAWGRVKEMFNNASLAARNLSASVKEGVEAGASTVTAEMSVQDLRIAYEQAAVAADDARREFQAATAMNTEFGAELAQNIERSGASVMSLALSWTKLFGIDTDAFWHGGADAAHVYEQAAEDARAVAEAFGDEIKKREAVRAYAASLYALGRAADAAALALPKLSNVIRGLNDIISQRSLVGLRGFRRQVQGIALDVQGQVADLTTTMAGALRDIDNQLDANRRVAREGRTAEERRAAAAAVTALTAERTRLAERGEQALSAIYATGADARAMAQEDENERLAGLAEEAAREAEQRAEDARQAAEAAAAMQRRINRLRIEQREDGLAKTVALIRAEADEEIGSLDRTVAGWRAAATEIGRLRDREIRHAYRDANLSLRAWRRGWADELEARRQFAYDSGEMASLGLQARVAGFESELAARAEAREQQARIDRDELDARETFLLAQAELVAGEAGMYEQLAAQIEDIEQRRAATSDEATRNRLAEEATEIQERLSLYEDAFARSVEIEEETIALGRKRAVVLAELEAGRREDARRSAEEVRRLAVAIREASDAAQAAGNALDSSRRDRQAQRGGLFGLLGFQARTEFSLFSGFTEDIAADAEDARQEATATLDQTMQTIADAYRERATELKRQMIDADDAAARLGAADATVAAGGVDPLEAAERAGLARRIAAGEEAAARMIDVESLRQEQELAAEADHQRKLEQIEADSRRRRMESMRTYAQAAMASVQATLGALTQASSMEYETWRSLRDSELESLGFSQEQRTKMIEEEGAKAFEEQKKLQIAQAWINGLAGMVGAVSSTAGMGPVGWVLGAVQAAAILRLTQAQVARIRATKPGGSGGGGGTGGYTTGNFSALNAAITSDRAGNYETWRAAGGFSTGRDPMDAAASRMEDAAARFEESARNLHATVDYRTQGGLVRGGDSYNAMTDGNG